MQGRGGGRSNRGGSGQSNVANAATTRPAATAGQPLVNDADRGGLPGLTDEQWSSLVNLLNSSKASSSTEKLHGKFSISSGQWIIDTGASNHMSGNVKLFNELHDVPPSPAGLPNGNHTTATKEGLITLTDDLILKDVLYVPNLTCNLLSVS